MAVAVNVAATADECLSRPSQLAYSQSMMVQTEDSALMLRYCDGDVAAFEQLYLRHKDSLYRYLLRLTFNPDTADDVFQDAWSKIIRARNNYRPTAKFSTYLFRVAHNCFIDYTRRNKRHSLVDVTDPDQVESGGEAPEQLAEKATLRARMLKLLRSLPEEQRDVFLLYEEAGLTLDDIATVTGANRETVKSRLRYATTKLKSGLTAGEPEEV